MKQNLLQMLTGNLKDYQPIPFWSWNDKLDNEELRQQIRDMKNIGIGGFFMHARGGLQTEYMGEEWFSAVQACIDEAKKQDMNAWCYDENGWPSGFAGMKLLEDKSTFVHYLTFKEKTVFDDNALSVYYIVDGNIKRASNDTIANKYICVYDNTNSSVVDILNREVVNKFIKETHDKYYDRFKADFGKVLTGFFTDEPQYYRWDTAYSPVMLKAYADEYNEDILDLLGALFVDCEQASGFRFRYWKLANKLYTNSFAKQIYDWCEEHNCKLTGHSIEEQGLFYQMWCCAGVMPFYEYEHIPGIDWLGREISTEITPRQVSSVALQLNKKQVLTETFACTGWDVTPLELKRIAQWQFVNGVNLICHHLYPYSIRGQRKRDYPVFFSEHNPWHTALKEFNDYFTTLGYMLANSKEVAKVGVIHPMHSAYLTYNRASDYESVKDLEDNFRILVETLGAANIGHHYIDETILERHGNVSENKLLVGQCTYDFIVIPKMDNLDSNTATMLAKYIENGGKICLAGNKPCLINGKKADLDFLKSNITFEDLNNEIYKIDMPNEDVRSTFRHSDFGDFLYVVNLSVDKIHEVKYKICAKKARLFDAMNKKYLPLSYSEEESGYINVCLKLNPCESFVVVFDESNMYKENLKYINQDINKKMKLVARTENSLTIDYVSLSYDNITYQEKLPVMAVSDKLLRERKNQTIYLKYVFNVADKVENIFVELEKMNSTALWINGEKVNTVLTARLDKSFIRINLVNYLCIGQNEIRVKIDYEQSKHVYDVFNGTYYEDSDLTESFMNCLSYDTDIEAIYILGDFDVKSENGYNAGKKKTLIAEGGFSIAKSNSDIDVSQIITNGMPFFAGDITFETNIQLDSKNCDLQLIGRYAISQVELNGKFVGKSIFNETFDLSDFAIIGDNKLRITLTNGNRNIYGPFHFLPDDEPMGVGPELMNQYGTWDNGKSKQYRDSYSFAYFGLDKITVIKKYSK